PAARYARFTGRPARRDGDLNEIVLDRGSLRFATPAQLQDAFGLTPAGMLPCLVAASIRVASLTRLEACLPAGLDYRRTASAIAVVMPKELGDALIFHEG